MYYADKTFSSKVECFMKYAFGINGFASPMTLCLETSKNKWLCLKEKTLLMIKG